MARIVYAEEVGININDVFPNHEYDFMDEDDDFMQKLNQHADLSLLKRGDILALYHNGYRNDGRFIFNGEKIIPLSFDLDEYGHLPKEFHDFPPGYFKDVIEHNYICWFEAPSDMNFKREVNEYGDVVFVGKCFRNGIPYLIVYEEEIVPGLIAYRLDVGGDYYRTEGETVVLFHPRNF